MRVEMGGFTISKRQKELVNQVLNSGRLSYGPMTEKFEKMWAKLHNLRYALFCNSGTSALQVALHALKEKYHWKDGSEVIIPALTFVATMNIVIHNNLKPVFVDIEKDYFCINPKLIEKAITKKTKAIIVVHLLGQPCQMDKIMKIAKKHKLKVIEDSCETVGASYKGQMVGSFGDISCFSTYASHLIVTGVGGFACTNDPDLALLIRGLYNHGRDGIYHSIDDNKKGIQIMKSRFNFTHIGYSYRLTECEAALGIGHLERFNEELLQRKKIADLLLAGLDDLELDKHIMLPNTYPDATHSFMLFAIVFRSDYKTREELLIYLEEAGIATRYMMPLINQPIFRKLYGMVDKKYPVAAYMNKHAFLIGCHPEMTIANVNYIIKIFKEYFYES